MVRHSIAHILRSAAVLVVAGALADGGAVLAGEARVRVLRTPDGGIQPQAAIGADGRIHLIYFKGEPGAGDLFYVSLAPGQHEFSRPLRVNSEPGTAIAIGTIRGGQLALGKGDRVHVAWNGASAAPSGTKRHEGAPMFATRLNEARTAFEPQRDLIHKTAALDGGGTIAADPEGNVYVAWHGRGPDTTPGEQGRRLWVARSTDEGATFSAEEPVFSKETGACACCGTRALADRRGALYLLYRAATGGIERDMYLLRAPSPSAHVQGQSLRPWKINACPMSSASLADAGPVVLAAWETMGEVDFVRIDPKNGSVSPRVAPPGRGGSRKHPAIAGNARGETLLAWTEGTGWQKGGSLAWQLFDRDDHPTQEKGKVSRGIPVWSLPTVVARPDGGFTLIH